MSEQQLLWAELRRGTDVLFIPSTGWEEAVLPRIGDYEAKWEEWTGSWAVSADAARFIATAMRQLSVSDLSKCLARRKMGEFWSGTLAIDAISEQAAKRLREKAVGFLENGEFHWRFVQLSQSPSEDYLR